MRTAIGLSITLAACTSGSERQLPTAAFTPHLDSQQAPVACGEDVAFYGNPSPDLRYLFTYDTAGRLTNATGAWANNGPTDTIDYMWSGDNLTHMLGVSGWDNSENEITAHYDASDSLLDYTWSYSDATYSDAWTYTYSSFIGVNQPTQLAITTASDPTVWSYQLAYDASNRLVQATPSSGPATTWTYDDAAGTITSDTGNGAWQDVLTFDADYRILSATWGGTDPSVIDGEQVYAWTGDQLDTVTYRSGSEQAPHQLDLVQVDTLRYDCSAARTGKTTKMINARVRR
jgi:YD repeat-containing protein